MTELLQIGRLAMDGRMLGPAGTGVAAYARALRQAQLSLAPDCEILSDDRGRERSTRRGRWLRALAPWSEPTTMRADGNPHGHDLFRMAQIWFDVHRRLLPVKIPGKAGIMHWTYPVPLRVIGWKNVYTVHDVIPLTNPALTPIDPRRHRRMLNAIVEEAQHSGQLMAVSQAAATEIADVLACPPGLITTCFQSVDLADDPAIALPKSLQNGGFLLVCGSVEPRKNIDRIIAAYLASGVPHPLVIAGPADSGIERVTVGATTSIVRLSSLDNATMTALLARAHALLMPSLAEGFGRPIIEAMLLGTPSLTSDFGALAEIAGGAALLVNPHDQDSLTAGIRRICTDEELRRNLIARGRQNACRFSPARFATNLAGAYSRLIAPIP